MILNNVAALFSTEFVKFVYYVLFYTVGIWSPGWGIFQYSPVFCCPILGHQLKIFFEKSNPHLYPGLPPWGLNIDPLPSGRTRFRNRLISEMISILISGFPKLWSNLKSEYLENYEIQSQKRRNFPQMPQYSKLFAGTFQFVLSDFQLRACSQAI